jgi:2'-5' RNA ligase
MRCFVAVELDDVIKKEISKFLTSFNYISMKSVEDENLHITLKFLGEIEEKKIEEVEENLKLVSSQFEPFAVEFTGIGVFPNVHAARVLWIAIKGEKMVELAKKVDDSLYSSGFPRERSIIPHITIGRIRQVSNWRRLEEDLNRYSTLTFGKMEIQSIKIKKSILTPKGPVYSDLKVVRL